MHRQHGGHPQQGYRPGNGSSDGYAYSSSSGGSNRPIGHSRPIIKSPSTPLRRSPEQYSARPNQSGSPVGPKTPGSEQSSFTLNDHHISETYRPRSSPASNLPKPESPSYPVSTSDYPRQRPASRYTSNNSLIQNRRMHWASEQELKILVRAIPREYWTKHIYFVMSELGTVVRIEMQQGNGYNDAWVVFQPPPTKPLPQLVRIGSASIRYETRTSFVPTVPSPINPSKNHHEVNILNAKSLDFGVNVAEKKLATMHRVENDNIKVTLNLKRKELDIQFPLMIDGANRSLRFRLPISQLSQVYKVDNGSGTESSIIIPFETSPQFFVQKKPSRGDDQLFPAKERNWNDWSTWYRETDVVDDRTRALLQSIPVMNHKNSAIIDIGRWTTYRFAFDNTTFSDQKFLEFRDALCDYGVSIYNSDGYEVVPGVPYPLSEMLQEEITGTHPHLDVSTTKSTFDTLFSSHIHLSFPVRYQLEACLSNGLLKENNITPEFLGKLASMNAHEAVHILEKVFDKQNVYYNPMDIFKIRKRPSSQRVLPKHCIMQRSVNITPTTMHIASPAMEISNRITRRNLADTERFIRVKFSDEKSEGVLRNMPGGRADAPFDRVSRAMKHGIVVAGRFYEFLAFGNSQFREHGAYFYAPTSTNSADDIRATLGQFDHIRTVAKYGARIGQCFSTTRAMQTTVTVQKIPDIERNGYTFTDGVGKLSLFLAKMAAQDLGLHNAFEDPPSLFQFRLGGCKGVLALDPQITKNQVCIRPSQYKFEATYAGLEIIRCSSLATPYFNRQIIIVLSDLGVPADVFLRKQQQMVNAYELAMTDRSEAMHCLLKHIDMNQTTLTMASMVLDGFMESREPFVMSLLNLWRASTIKDLKKKARIAIDEGAFVLGCVDESGTLKGHCDDPQSRLDASREEKLATLPEVFVQVDDTSKKGHYKVIEGVCILARNPSLHPGDIRVVRAVDVPALRHHKNVVVLPQTGDRDLANMCSGGDLDGDDYMILWDRELLPEVINVPPMDFTPEKPIEKVEPITISDISDFFVTYMKNDSLGQIAHAHLAQADQEDAGVNSHTCLELAKLHSQAVDYPKSGIPAVMDNTLRPKRWPHFMEKKHLPTNKIYRSKNILGMLYDQVQLVDFKPVWEDNFDQRILDCFELDQPLLEKAAEIKADYDNAFRRLMAKHGIETEFEAFSVFVLVHNNESRDYKFAEEFGRTVGVLKSQYREVCINAAGATSMIDWDRLGPFIAAMYTVMAQEMRKALKECHMSQMIGGQEVPVCKRDAESMPLMSFPWLFHSELGKIATGGQSNPRGRLTHIRRPQKYRLGSLETDFELGAVETDEGVTQVGELLNLDFGTTGGTGSFEHYHTKVGAE